MSVFNFTSDGLKSSSLWQIAAGDEGRPYRNHFFQHSVAFIGPGRFGPWYEGRSIEDFGEEGRYVRRFAEKMQKGDLIVLRETNTSISAFGIVVSNYGFSDYFDDVLGWNLQHFRRVVWYELEEFKDFGFQVGAADRLSQIHTNREKIINFINERCCIENLAEQESRHGDNVLGIISRCINSTQSEVLQHEIELSPIPQSEPEYRVPRDLLEIIYDIRNYYHEVEDETEACSVVHCIVPFLRALGWINNQMSLEFTIFGDKENSRADICLFSDSERSYDKCDYVIEAKGWGKSLEGNPLRETIEKANTINLGKSAGLPPCAIVLSDGYRYLLYEKRSDESDYEQAAYTNLMKMRASSENFIDHLRRNC